MSRRGGGASPLILYYFQNSDYKYLLENVNVFAFKHIVIHNLLFVLFFVFSPCLATVSWQPKCIFGIHLTLSNAHSSCHSSGIANGIYYSWMQPQTQFNESNTNKTHGRTTRSGDGKNHSKTSKRNCTVNFKHSQIKELNE